MKRTMSILLASSAMAFSVMGTVAHAEDMIVIRKVFRFDKKAYPNQNQGGDQGGNQDGDPGSDPNAGGSDFGWVEGSDWAGTGTKCSADYQQTQTVFCQSSSGAVLADDYCDASSRPSDSRTIQDFSECSYSWKSGDWSYAPSCGAQVQTREISCERSDGQIVSAENCAASSPPDETRTIDDYTTCGYNWNVGAWSNLSSTCSTEANRTRSVTCQRSDGETSPDAFCGGNKPKSIETVSDLTGCTYSWYLGPWNPAPGCGNVTASREVSCKRSDGKIVGDEYCTATKPALTRTQTDYSSCTFTWQVGDWGNWDNSCSSVAKRTRDVSCLRSDDSIVSSGYCDPLTQPANQELSENWSGCTYSWRSDNFVAENGCGEVIQSRNVWCVRNSGLSGDLVSNSYCNPETMPAPSSATTNYTTCTYGWAVGAWEGGPSCGSGSQTRSVECQRSNSDIVNDGYCNGISKPISSQPVTDYSGCTWSWTTGNWTIDAPACGSTTQSRTVTCKRNDGTEFANSYCDPETRPETNQAAVDYSTCTYEWEASEWGAWSTSCGNATRTRAVTCVRQDGLGTIASNASCNAATKPISSETSYITTDCLYEWQYSALSKLFWQDAHTVAITEAYQCVYTPTGAVVANSTCNTILGPVGEASDLVGRKTYTKAFDYSYTMSTNMTTVYPNVDFSTTTPYGGAFLVPSGTTFNAVKAQVLSLCQSAGTDYFFNQCSFSQSYSHKTNGSQIWSWTVFAPIQYAFAKAEAAAATIRASDPGNWNATGYYGVQNYSLATKVMTIHGAAGKPWCGTTRNGQGSYNGTTYTLSSISIVCD